MSTGPRNGRLSAILQWWQGVRGGARSPAPAAADVERWVTMYERFGSGNFADPPTNAEIRGTIRAVLDEAALLRTLPHLDEGGLEEHPNCWIASGTDEGPVFTLDLYRGGMLLFTTRADEEADDDEPVGEKHGVSIAEAERLFRALRDGRIAEVEAAFRVA
ncbi:MAG TPA: hypothetical protein VFR37_08225 [Longimicrobium sp.]|nr:hypothetical protein [Longimicrobium sp.]